MAASVLYMSMSLDGYIAGPNDEPGNPGGDGFDRLHEWFVTPHGEFFRPSGPPGELVDELNATGAVLVGRRTVEQVDHWKGDHHGVPIFVPSHRPPSPSVANYPLVTYVLDGIESAKTCGEVGRRCLRPRPILTGTLAEKSWFDRSWRVGAARAPLADSALNSCCDGQHLLSASHDPGGVPVCVPCV